ncbi:MAG: nucleotidyltransferase domain-containing protein [Candidatus Omnitrophica bacterium]|nr:nucleotidyltransferase domain-containing protein [Candidatus Omnitrophota bacterium]
MLERVLKLFYKDVDGEFTILQIARRIGVSYSYVYRQVELLTRQGIISINVSGRRKYCKPNYENPRVLSILVKISAEETQNFLSTRKKIAFIVKELLSRLPQKTNYNLLSVILYGSFVKSTQVNKSDIDLFVLVPSKERYDEIVENECISLTGRYGVEVSPLVSEPQSFLNMLREREHNVAKEILKDKVVLYGAEKFWELVLGVIK